MIVCMCIAISIFVFSTYNCGTVFRMSPLNLTFSTIYSFQCKDDGSWPVSGVRSTAPNVLHGVTREGGAFGFGNCTLSTHILMTQSIHVID
jgi:hypothetical protein